MTTSVRPAGHASAGGRDEGRGDGVDRFVWWTAAAAVVGLALRVGWVVWAHRPPLGLFDPARYAAIAEQIAQGKGYVEPFNGGQASAYYPPGYPYFLGAVQWITQHTPLPDDLPLVAGLVQAALGTVSVVFVAVVARRLGGPRAGIIAAFAMAIYPNLIFYTGVLLSETLYIFLFLGFLVVLLGRPWPEALTTRRVAAAAALLALSVLVRPISLAIVPVLAVVWWRQRCGGRAVLRLTGITLLVLVACIAPWTVRNAIRLDAFVPISTNTGDNLCIGHAPDAKGGFTFTRFCRTSEGIEDGTEGEVRSDRTKTRRGLRSMRENLGREPYLVGQRAHITFRSDAEGLVAAESFRTDRFLSSDEERLLTRFANASYLVVAVAGVVGLLRLSASRRPDRLLLVLSAFATVAVPLLLFFGEPRFKVPVLPLLIVAGGCAFAPAGPRRAPGPSRRRRPAGAAEGAAGGVDRADGTAGERVDPPSRRRRSAAGDGGHRLPDWGT